MTGERQATRIRSLYLKSVLRQEVAFFDVEMTTGQIVSRMSGDTVLVQDAIGEKVIIPIFESDECRSKPAIDHYQIISKCAQFDFYKLFRSASFNSLWQPSLAVS